MVDSFDREEFLAGYLAEAEEHLQSAGKHLLHLEVALGKGEAQPRIVRELFRSLHTLKGLSAMVGLEQVVAIAHEMETIVRIADQAASSLSAQAIGLLLKAIKAMDQRVGSYGRREPVAEAPESLLVGLRALVPALYAQAKGPSSTLSLPKELLAKLTRSEQEQLSAGIERGQRALRAVFMPTPDRSARGVTITTVRERVAKLAEIVKVLPSSVPKTAEAPGGLVFVLLLLTSVPDAELAAAIEVGADSLLTIQREAAPVALSAEFEELTNVDDVSQSSSIRVEVKRLDEALEGLSALVVTRFRLGHALARLREQGSDVRELAQVLNDQTREIRQLRATITRARMVSLSQLLERAPLLVRGMSASSGKQVRLAIEAGRAELDKGVADRVFPAILHLIRNAIDHGIEPAAEREQAGKPAQGVVSLLCLERSDNQLELSISDDGRGIDREQVAKKAGVPVPSDEAGLLALITRPGLSTQEVATDRSGRGMGMEIVKRIVVETLGGALSLTTERAHGTTFTLRIPLSISILDSLSFQCGNQVFVVPLAAVEEIVDLSAARILRSPNPNQRGVPVSMLRQRDADIPLMPLSALFALTKTEFGSRADSRASTRAQSAVIVRKGQQRFGFEVDRMLSQQEVVIRPLADPLVKVPGVSGTTDLGDGRPTLVLDLMSLTGFLAASAQGAMS
jgi:two-component system, chemotaxis family, sensor kinase CheA